MSQNIFLSLQFLTACKLSQLRQYKPLDTIYSHDRGTLSNVYFILSGECVILQCLHIRVTYIIHIFQYFNIFSKYFIKGE